MDSVGEGLTWALDEDREALGQHFPPENPHTGGERPA